MEGSSHSHRWMNSWKKSSSVLKYHKRKCHGDGRTFSSMIISRNSVMRANYLGIWLVDSTDWTWSRIPIRSIWVLKKLRAWWKSEQFSSCWTRGRIGTYPQWNVRWSPTRFRTNLSNHLQNWSESDNECDIGCHCPHATGRQTIDILLPSSTSIAIEIRMHPRIPPSRPNTYLRCKTTHRFTYVLRFFSFKC